MTSCEKKESTNDHETERLAGAPRCRRCNSSAIGTAPSIAAIVVIMDRPEADQTALINRLLRGHAAPFGFEREVDLHDGVLFDDADQHDHADEGVDAFRSIRKRISVTSAPKAAEGRPERIVSGWI